MITVRSSASDITTYQIFEDDNLIGFVRLLKDTTSDKYQASVFPKEEDNSGKIFDSPQDALQWVVKIKKSRAKVKSN
ncbi:MAG TPA: hypothetical protein PKM41_07545 [Deltaproteobacteria bacterium]|jgi:hypothetical protein|nr:hypothetical protein [Deltaproteobacteria bacterium]HOI06933.1 hypothetical protein [Deltaproteobacteria bacterium]